MGMWVSGELEVEVWGCFTTHHHMRAGTRFLGELVLPALCHLSGYTGPRVFAQTGPFVFTQTGPPVFAKSGPLVFGQTGP